MTSDLPIINGGEIKTFTHDSVFFKEDEIGHCMYILIHGKIKVTKNNKVIANLTEMGSTIGELSLLLDLPYTATCRSIGETKVIAINLNEEFFETNPNFLLYIAKNLATKLIAANRSKLIYF